VALVLVAGRRGAGAKETVHPWVGPSDQCITGCMCLVSHTLRIHNPII
jgi:hypothetical protein